MTQQRIYITKYNNKLDMSTIESQIEQKKAEIKALREKEVVARITSAISTGNRVELLKACASLVSRNQKKGAKVQKK